MTGCLCIVTMPYFLTSEINQCQQSEEIQIKTAFDSSVGTAIATYRISLSALLLQPLVKEAPLPNCA